MTRQLEVVLDDTALGPTMKVGTLYRERDGSSEVISFVYDRDYLSQRWSFAIDPELHLVEGRSYPARDRGIFGIFRDTAPDRWGRLLMERREAIEAQQERRQPRRLTDWDFLIGVSDLTRMGALRLRQIDPPHGFVDDREHSAPPVTRLRELEAIARELSREGVEDRPEYAQWLAQLIAPGTSLGGARPKASFSTAEGDLWLAKFPAHDDRRDIGAWEYLAFKLAHIAGIDMPDARILRFGSGYRTFAVKRFDRANGSRRLYASAMTLLTLNDGDAGSYLDIAQAIQTYGDPAGIVDDLAQLYRRIVFSILVGNRDDHFRNHGFLRAPGGWRLSPAFDINPNPDKNEHTLAIDEANPMPAVSHLHATHHYYRLTDAQATAIEDEVRDAVSRWRGVADALELSRTAQSQIAAIIDDMRA